MMRPNESIHYFCHLKTEMGNSHKIIFYIAREARQGPPFVTLLFFFPNQFYMGNFFFLHFPLKRLKDVTHSYNIDINTTPTTTTPTTRSFSDLNDDIKSIIAKHLINDTSVNNVFFGYT
jgi:hypothetical protein